MNEAIRFEGRDAGQRLAQLGLEEERLLDAVRQGYVAFISCTQNHPPLIRGIWAWGETVRALRDYVLPLGWTRSDENNYSVVVEPSGRIAIAVATGDDGTGRTECTPSTKASKGPSTADAVITNRQMSLFTEPESDPSPASVSEQVDERVTWILLVCRSQDEVRCELSLPLSMGVDGKIDGWSERILLGPLPLGGDLVEVVPPTVPDITVNVQRLT